MGFPSQVRGSQQPEAPPRPGSVQGAGSSTQCPAAPRAGQAEGPVSRDTLAVNCRMGGLWQRWGGSLDSVKSLNKFVDVTGHLQMNNVTLRKKFAQTPYFAVHVKPAARPRLTLNSRGRRFPSSLPEGFSCMKYAYARRQGNSGHRISKNLSWRKGSPCCMWQHPS